MKITGAEWKDFEATGWPEGYIWSDESTLEDGRDIYDNNGELVFGPDEVFTVPALWGLFYEGPEGKQIDNGDGLDMRATIRKWRKARSFETVTVTVPKGQADKLRQMCDGMGWKAAGAP